MTSIASPDDIIALYGRLGGQHYGEGVTQTEHAVQCAVLAEESGASADLIVASLLHDIGHLVVDPADCSVDDRHETAGAEALDAMFGEAVSRAVALHVSAKRYLCRIEPAYLSALSPASRKSLLVQGGAFDRIQAEAFERLPGWRDAVALRRFDDWGKSDRSARRRFADFVPLLRQVAAAHG